MATPIISLYSSDNSTVVSTWSPGVVKADSESKELEVYVWNNKSTTPGTANSTAVSDMIECTVGVLDAAGTATEPIAKEKWIQVNINDEKDSGVDKWIPIGGTTTADLWNAAAADSHASGDKAKDFVIKGGTNTGMIDTGDNTNAANKGNYCKCRFKIAVPQNASPGTNGFKIRFQGYYV